MFRNLGQAFVLSTFVTRVRLAMKRISSFRLRFGAAVRDGWSSYLAHTLGFVLQLL